MKTTLVLSLIFTFTASPAARSAELPMVAAATEPAEATEVNQPDSAAAPMTGSYVGMFGENKITVQINKVVGSTVMGYSVVAGNERAFSGSFSHEGPTIRIEASEPGDHPEDGAFSFVFDPAAQILSGSWTPKNKKLAAKTFQLARRDFKYDPNLGSYPETSTKLLTVADVENVHSEELRLMRNEIYARHGYSFRLKEMREYFDKEDWYMPVSTDVLNTLTKLEWSNEGLIKRYEKYAKENYDSFGR